MPSDMFSTMMRRVTAALLALLILPAPALAGTTPCTAVQGVASGNHLPPQVTGHPAPHDAINRGQHARCDTPASDNCCQMMASCVAVALPSVATGRIAPVLLGIRIAEASVESPIGRSLAPEPPPPKA